MTDWSLRLAHRDDAERMPAIEASAGKLFETVETLEGVAVQDTIAIPRLRTLIAKGHCLVASVGEVMAGFLVTEPFGRELHMVECSVHAAHQRKGIGGGLLRACLIDARNSGFDAVTLTTFRNVPWNAPFYGRLGFVTVADDAAHPRLAAELAKESEHGLARDMRCAMIRFLD